MRSPYLPVISGLAVLLLSITLPTQLRLRNAPVLISMTFLLLSGIGYLINTLVWAGNVRDVAPIWCDISTNIWFYGQYATACAVFCMTVQLECITSRRNSMSFGHNRILFDVVVSLIVPLFAIPLRYSLSTNRYMILEDLGCLPALHPSKLAVVIVFSTQFVITLCICGFAGKAIFNLFRRRYFTASLITPSKSAITHTRFLRLLAFCLIIMIWSPVVIGLTLYYGLSLAFLPWPGWAAVHKEFPHILRIPFVLEFSALHKAQSFLYWSFITTTFVGFVILSSSEDVRSDYRRAWAYAIPILGRRRGASAEMSTLASHKSKLSVDTGETPQEVWTIVVELDQDVEEFVLRDETMP